MVIPFSSKLNNNETPDWTIDYWNYAYSMTLTARIQVRDSFPNSIGHQLAAFHEGELRGVTTATLQNDMWLFFLTIYSNQANDSIYFKYYHDDQSSIFAVDDSINFVSLDIIGDIENPYSLNAGFLSLEQNQSILCPQIIDQDTAWIDTVYVIATEMGTAENHVDSTRIIFRVGENPVMPVDLLSFRGEKIDRQVLLKWQIANPDGFWGFEIERKSDSPSTGGTEWSTIGSIEFVPGKMNYDFWDKQANWEDNYYRLRMIDFDGSFEFSNLVHIQFESNELLSLIFFPNPVSNQTFQLEVSTATPGSLYLEIINTEGQVLQTQTYLADSNRQLIPLNISDFPSGIYWARIKLGNRSFHRNFSVIKE